MPTFRANTVGDSWTYNVKIDFGQFGSGPGTLVESLTSDTYNGAASIRDTRTFNLDVDGSTEVLSSYTEIGTTGGLLAETVNNALVAVQTNTYGVPSTIGLGTSVSGVTTLVTGLSFSQSYTVEKTARITVPAGTFDCWLVSATDNHSDGTKDVYTMWVAPQIGNYVQIQDTTTTSTPGDGYTYTAQLASMVTP